MRHINWLWAVLVVCASSAHAAGPAWDKTTATKFSAMAYASACEESAIQRFNCKWCRTSGLRGFVTEKYVTDAPTKGAAFIGYSPLTNQIMLSYRSTVLTEWRSILVDFTFDKVDFKDDSGAVKGQVHKGFSEAHDALMANGLRAALDGLVAKYPDAGVVFIGHSLGGALATLGAAQFSARTGKAALVYSYGSPRVGDKTFGTWFATLPITYYRHVTADDPVPHAPRLAQGFVHVNSGQELWFKKIEDADPQVCPLGENGSCANTVHGATNFMGAHASYLGNKFDQCGIGAIAEFQDFTQTAMGKMDDVFDAAQSGTTQAVAATTTAVTATTTAVTTTVSGGLEKGREALKTLPGLAALGTSSLVEAGKNLKVSLQGAQPPRVFLVPGPDDAWHAVVLPAPDQGDLSPATLWPQFGADVFGDAAILPQAIIISPRAATLDPATLPEEVRSAFSSFPGMLELKPGGNAFAKVRLSRAGATGQISRAIGLAEGSLVLLKGSVGPELVGKLLEKAVGPQEVVANGPTSYAMNVTFPAATPPILKNQRAKFSVEFPSTSVDIAVQGGTVSLAGTQAVDLYSFGKKVSLTNTLTFTKDGSAYSIGCNASAQADANLLGTDALGFPVQSIGLSGQLSVATGETGKKSIEGLGLGVNVTLKNGLQGDFAVAMKGAAISELTVSLKSAQPIRLDSLAAFKDLPGASEFAFQEFGIGINPVDKLGSMFGSLEWRGVRVSAAVIAGKVTVKGTQVSTLALFLKGSGFKLSKLNPKIPASVDVIPLDNVLLVVSKNKLENVTGGELPARVASMVEEVAGATNGKFSFIDGLTLVTSYAPDPSMKQPMQVLGLGESPMIIAGQVGGVFKGDPSLGLYADLGTFKLPEKSRPGFMNVTDVTPKFFLVARDLKSAPALDLGLELGVGLKVGGDTLAMGLSAYATLGASGVGVSAKGTMKGTWNNPLGLKNMSIADTTVGFGIDGNPSATVTVKVGGTMSFDKFNYTTAGIIGLATAAPFPGTPTKVGLGFVGSELSPVAQLRIMETFMTSAVSGPLSSAIPDQKTKDALKKIVSQGTTLTDHATKAIPLDFLKLKDVKLFIATPGATDPDMPAIKGMGVGATGTLEFLGTRFASTDSFVTVDEGMKLNADIKDFDVGPVLSLKGAKLDVRVPMPAPTPDAIPWFKLKGKAKVLIATADLEIEASKNKLKFKMDNDWGSFGKANFRAESLGESLFKPTDFILEMDGAADLKNGIRKQLVPAMNKVSEAAKKETDKSLSAAKSDLKSLESTLATKRNEATKDRDNAGAALEKARNQVNSARSRIDDTNDDIDSKKKKIKKADKEWRVDKAASLRVELGWLYTRREGERAALDVAEKALKGLGTVTSNIPIDMMPEVTLALSAVEAKKSEIVTLEASKSATSDLDKLAAAISKGAGAIPLTIDEIAMRNVKLSSAVTGEGQDIRIRATVTLDPQHPFTVDEALTINLMNPTQLDLTALATAINDTLQGRATRKTQAASGGGNPCSATPTLLNIKDRFVIISDPSTGKYLSWRQGTDDAKVMTLSGSNEAVVWKLEATSDYRNQYFLRSTWGCPSDGHCNNVLSWKDGGESVYLASRFVEDEYVPWIFTEGPNPGEFYLNAFWHCPGHQHCNKMLTRNGEYTFIRNKPNSHAWKVTFPAQCDE